MKLEFTPRFQRNYKGLIKRNAQLRSIFDERIGMFLKNKNDPRLRNHLLVGRLDGAHSISLGYDLRALYYLKEGTYTFFDIGTHDDVYR